MEIQSPALVAAMKDIRNAVVPLACVFKMGEQKRIGFYIRDAGGEVCYSKEALSIADLEKAQYCRALIQEARSCLEAQGLVLQPWPST